MKALKRFFKHRAFNWYERIVWALVGRMMGKHGYKYLTVMRNEQDDRATAFIFDSIERSYNGY